MVGERNAFAPPRSARAKWELIIYRLQGGRRGGRDAPTASGGAIAPVRVGPAGAPLEGAGPSTTDPTLAVNLHFGEIEKGVPLALRPSSP